MSAKQDHSGGCLCGGVRFSVTLTKNGVGACHCTMCRRWSGGPFLAVHCDAPVRFEGEDNIVRYKSSEWAERGFCKTCGTHLFYYLNGSSEYILTAGAFDDQSSFVLESEIFVDEQPAFYAFANDTKKMTGAEVIAMFAPESAEENK